MNPLTYKGSNYDKYPVVQLPDTYTEACFSGWEAITGEIRQKLQAINKREKILVVECYPGVDEKEIRNVFEAAFPDALCIHSKEGMLEEEELNALLKEDVTEDELFGYMTRRNIDCYFDPQKVVSIRKQIQSVSGQPVIVYGTGAAYLQPTSDILVYADMARWEIQQRFRRNEVGNVGLNNAAERTSLQYKRGFFVDWRICDRFKKKLMPYWNYVLDTNSKGQPNMAIAEAIEAGLKQAIQQPFRAVPFFDPGPWGEANG